MSVSRLRSVWNICIDRPKSPAKVNPSSKQTSCFGVNPAIDAKAASEKGPARNSFSPWGPRVEYCRREMSSIEFLQVHWFLARLWCWWGFRYIQQMLVPEVHTPNHHTLLVSRDIGGHLCPPSSKSRMVLDAQNQNHGVTWRSSDPAPGPLRQSAHCQRFALQ